MTLTRPTHAVALVTATITLFAAGLAIASPALAASSAQPRATVLSLNSRHRLITLVPVSDNTARSFAYTGKLARGVREGATVSYALGARGRSVKRVRVLNHGRLAASFSVVGIVSKLVGVNGSPLDSVRLGNTAITATVAGDLPAQIRVRLTFERRHGGHYGIASMAVIGSAGGVPEPGPTPTVPTPPAPTPFSGFVTSLNPFSVVFADGSTHVLLASAAGSTSGVSLCDNVSGTINSGGELASLSDSGTKSTTGACEFSAPGSESVSGDVLYQDGSVVTLSTGGGVVRQLPLTTAVFGTQNVTCETATLKFHQLPGSPVVVDSGFAVPDLSPTGLCAYWGPLPGGGLAGFHATGLVQSVTPTSVVLVTSSGDLDLAVTDSQSESALIDNDPAYVTFMVDSAGTATLSTSSVVSPGLF